ncbi:hypothetical protein ABH923_000279 [Leifsonia sp. EB41]|uniref:hypothetical protein n=1 Tax=Leifsonia sp. EB41 TaxID=3156260 RepID=UPI003518F616
MAEPLIPRLVISVLVEEHPNSIVVTWELGERIETPAPPEYFGYGVDYYGPDGNGGKRLGIRFGSKVEAFIFDFTDANQSNYVGESVRVLEEGIVVSYRDASLGLPGIGQISAFSHVNGDDAQTQLPVTVLR